MSLAWLRIEFPKGCRVMLSEEGERTILHQVKPWLRRGTVVGYGRDGAVLYIHRDGTGQAQPYGAMFWERYR
ncbi:MAG TPA: DUF4314 domain-containing protein [Candidatus Dormibacteraeota bacterium]|jgi:hypothetical protein